VRFPFLYAACCGNHHIKPLRKTVGAISALFVLPCVAFSFASVLFHLFPVEPPFPVAHCASAFFLACCSLAAPQNDRLETFKQLDTDGDGVISKKEAGAGAAALRMSKQQAMNAFDPKTFSIIQWETVRQTVAKVLCHARRSPPSEHKLAGCVEVFSLACRTPPRPFAVLRGRCATRAAANRHRRSPPPLTAWAIIALPRHARRPSSLTRARSTASPYPTASPCQR